MHRLEEKLRKRLIGEWYGSFETLFKGQGVAVSDSRRYQPGDQKATINRKQSAKHDQLYVNEYEAERTATVDFFLDINANRSAGVDATNRSLVKNLIADYMVFAVDNGLITTGYIGDGKEIFSRSLGNEREWMSWYDDAEQVTKLQSKRDYCSSLTSFLHRAKTITKRRVLIIVSDFLDLGEDDVALLERLDQKHILISIPIGVSQIIGKDFDLLTVKQSRLKLGGVTLI